MKLISTTNNGVVLHASDRADVDGDMWLALVHTTPISNMFWLNKSGAAILVKHLQETFGLEK
jgi:hypothetical protein